MTDESIIAITKGRGGGQIDTLHTQNIAEILVSEPRYILELSQSCKEKPPRLCDAKVEWRTADYVIAFTFLSPLWR